ncbi:MAG: threonine--tRNA ligase [Clostridiales bacterium]|nr:threonine--tRNA ligase [Clostridiales bacterium]
MLKITLKDGTIKEFDKGISVFDAAATLSQGLARVALVGEIDGKVVDLSYKLQADGRLKVLTFDDDGGRDAYRHTSSHILAQAVKRLYPAAKLAIGPAIDTGFYYDFDVDRPFTSEDLGKIETEMNMIIKADYQIEKFTLPRMEAVKLMEELGESYKVELINDLPPDAELSFYRQGDFTDLCAGPHLPSTGRIKAFKLLTVAGAYWRGNEKNKMLQRIYGTSYPKKAELDEYLNMLLEAEKRDHRRLGKDLGLYSMNDSTGQGLVLWHPKGARIRVVVEDFWRSEHFRNGYDIVYSPHIGRSILWETSGHLDFYRENMYSGIEIDDQVYFLKPMNCPFHIMMYKTGIHSYRDLPLRWAELGTVYRYEKSGVLHGLLRVRGFTQDDAHIFCTPEQMPSEIRRVLKFCLHILGSFGFVKFKMYIATRPKEKSVGDPEMWKEATDALIEAADALGLDREVDEGGGAFYGPKIDIKIKDALNREWQCSTIQFDFNLPDRFDLNYITPGGEKRRPYMIHHAILGSLERFFGILIEHYAGALPLWLSPVQARILPILEKHYTYAEKVKEALEEAGLRCDIDFRNEKIGYRIREAQLEKIPYMLVIGDREEEAGNVAVRSRKEGDLGSISLEDFISKASIEAKNRAL